MAPLPQNELAYALLKDYLKRKIVRPGSHLNVAQLAEQLKVGRTPLRQALQRLSAEGLVRMVPGKGAIAAPLFVADASNIIEVRLINEMLCLRLAAAHAGDLELDELEAQSTRVENAAAMQDVDGLIEADRRFHELIARASRNTIVEEVLDTLYARSRRFWTASLSNVEHTAEVVREHRAIVDALRGRDGDAAANAVRDHVLSFRWSLQRCG